MSRTTSRLAALLIGLLLALALTCVGSPGAVAADGDKPPHSPKSCLQPNADGDLPTCTWDGQRWIRSYDDGFSDPGSGGPGAGFAVLFVLVLVGGVAFTIWQVSTARRMARNSGMDTGDATAMTLLSDDGFEATYLASNLRGQMTAPAAPPPAVAPVAERLRELASLRDQGLITPEEHDVRRSTIIDSV
ncbi:MAG: hypothetical protein JWN22_853 [Nocardioides sp.]|jgi:hypothetical protein|nr:hypothetical protein [Nocardioides sp.]